MAGLEGLPATQRDNRIQKCFELWALRSGDGQIFVSEYTVRISRF